MITTAFTIADLPRSAFASEAEADEWLANNATNIRDNLIASLPDAIEMYLEIDGLEVDWGRGYFEAPKKPSQVELMEAALCLWEEILAWEIRMWDRERSAYQDDLSDRELAYIEFREWTGVSNIRMCMIDFAEPCHEAWVLAQPYDDCFDWKFVPWFVDQCIDWTEDGPELKSDWRELATKLGEK